MDVLGRDSLAECYRVRVGSQVARIPDVVISTSMQLTGGHGHQTAYDWIARHASSIERAVETLNSGRPPKAPFDRLTLEPTRPGPKT